jgi:hypothetical protein
VLEPADRSDSTAPAAEDAGEQDGCIAEGKQDHGAKVEHTGGAHEVAAAGDPPLLRGSAVSAEAEAEVKDGASACHARAAAAEKSQQAAQAALENQVPEAQEQALRGDSAQAAAAAAALASERKAMADELAAAQAVALAAEDEAFQLKQVAEEQRRLLAAQQATIADAKVAQLAAAAQAAQAVQEAAQAAQAAQQADEEARARAAEEKTRQQAEARQMEMEEAEAKYQAQLLAAAAIREQELLAERQRCEEEVRRSAAVELAQEKAKLEVSAAARELEHRGALTAATATTEHAGSRGQNEPSASAEASSDEDNDDRMRSKLDRSSILEVIAEHSSDSDSDSDLDSDSDSGLDFGSGLLEAQSSAIEQLAASGAARRQLQHSIEANHRSPSPVESAATSSSAGSDSDLCQEAEEAAGSPVVRGVSRAALMRWGRRRNARRRMLQAAATGGPTEHDFVLRKHGSAGKLCLLLDERVQRNSGGRRIVVSGLPKLPNGKPGPAEECGMEVGDELIAVGGRDVCGKSIRVCVALFQSVPNCVAVRVVRTQI